jgi:nucleoside-diphosphate-sugar epimerase
MKGVHGVFHLAGCVIHSRYNPKILYDTNVLGTLQVMEAASKNKWVSFSSQLSLSERKRNPWAHYTCVYRVRVVYASTSGVVGCQKRTTPWVVANDSSPYCTEIVKNWPYYKSKIGIHSFTHTSHIVTLFLSFCFSFSLTPSISSNTIDLLFYSLFVHKKWI